MTRFARKTGVIEKKEAKKKKEEATKWDAMFDASKVGLGEEGAAGVGESNDEDVKKRKHEEILDKKIQEDNLNEPIKKVAKSSSTNSNKREAVLKEYAEFIDQEVLQDLNDMLNEKKISEEEFVESVVREGRSNRRRLDRKSERDASIVCFKCRKTGHTINDCPEAELDCEQGTGICYKCGSTEHAVNKCKTRVEPGSFPYAKCFICNEMGHISKQCPDNPRGLYPNGMHSFSLLFFD
jgi:zinc finger CCHC domain-containing protein 9